MANSVSTNTIYVDTAAEGVTLTLNPSLIMGIMIGPSASTGGIVILKKTDTNGQIFFRAKLLDDQSRYIDFSGFGGISVPSTIYIATLTTITSVQIYGVFE